MNLIEAIVLGILQGLTEFLPISSSAHLRIAPSLFGWKDPGAAFTAVIQIGTLIAMLIYFFNDFKNIFLAWTFGIIKKQPFATVESRLGWMIIFGSIPIVICGLLFKDIIETSFRSLYVSASALIIFSIILWLADRKLIASTSKNLPLKELHNITWSDSIKVGLWQAIALIPGASRSGVTITGGMFSNFSRSTSARYSFLLSAPAVFGAGIFQLFQARNELLASKQNLLTLFVATLTAGITGYLAIAFLIEYLKKHSVNVFVYYRLILGGLILLLSFLNILKP